jgi:hypothetical protein
MTSSISIVYGTTLLQDRLREAQTGRQRTEARAARDRRRLVLRAPIVLAPRRA